MVKEKELPGNEVSGGNIRGRRRNGGEVGRSIDLHVDGMIGNMRMVHGKLLVWEEVVMYYMKGWWGWCFLACMFLPKRF